MSSLNDDHPPGDQLTAFAAGLLDEGQIAELEGHLERCATCVRALETVPEDRFVLVLRETSGRSAGAPPSLAVPGHELPPVGGEDKSPEGTRTSIPEALVTHPRYQMIRLLGRGGMGVVFLAEQVHLRRKVALKVLRDELVADPKAVERFRAEVKAAGRLSHPNIVTTYDADHVGETWFLVTEWVQGTPLSAIVAEQGPLPVAQVCKYVCQAAAGLEHARQRGIVHRDIKPGNLILTADGTVKILDFGLARFVAESEPEGSLTDFGTGLGTPDYVAPEQARNARVADIRADIYSLGCTLYFLLAGRPPFPGSSPAEKIAGHLERTPTPLNELRSDIPPELERVVERMMAKEPAQRFQTPAEVGRALGPFLSASPSSDSNAQTSFPAIRAKQSWRLLVSLAGLVALAVGTLLTATFCGLFQAPQRPAPTASRPAGGTNENVTAEGPQEISVLPAHADLVRSVAVSPDGRYLASGGYDKKVHLWHLPACADAGLFVHHSPVRFVGFSPEGDRLVFGGENGVVVADPEASRVVPGLRVPQQDLSAAALLSDNRLVSADGTGVVGQWDLDSGQLVRQFRMDALIFASFSRDGRYLLSSSGGKKVHLCDVPAGTTLLLLEGHTGPVRCVALSSNAQQALSGGDDESVRLWDLSSGKQVHRFTGHVGAVRCVAFSPDDTRALSGGEDGTLRLWDLAGKCQLLRLEGHKGAVWSVAFFPDGTRAASGGADGTVRLWDLRPKGKRDVSLGSGKNVPRSPRLIAYEGFDYPAGPISGKGTSADGWAGAWSTVDTGGSPGDASDFRVVESGLSYTDGRGRPLVTRGNRMQPSHGRYGNAVRSIDLTPGSHAERAGVIDPATGRFGKDGTSVWLSFLASGPATDLADDWVGVSLYDGSNAQDTERLFFGKPIGDTNWGVMENRGRKLLSDVPASQRVLFVVRLDFTPGSDGLSLWLNPALAVQPNAADAKLTLTLSDLRFDRLRIAGSSRYAVDEVRLGASYRDVTPAAAHGENK